nr:MAG TPA: hypothetical protein [Caudoviricetes sp.]
MINAESAIARLNQFRNSFHRSPVCASRYPSPLSLIRY